MFKKILLLVIFTIAMVGCTAHDMALWKEAKQESRESGETCYRRPSGTVYCKDDYGNRTY